MAAGNVNYNFNGQETNAMNYVLYGVAASGPWTESLQEVCQNTADTIAWNIGGSYRYLYMPAQPGALYCSNSSVHGNAVFSLGTWINAFHHEVGPYDGGEHRYISCIWAQGIGFSYLGCSTHLSKNHSYATQQAVDAAYEMASHGLWAIVAGDFNQVPNEGPPNGTGLFWWGYDELHSMNGAYWTGTFNAKYDYIFAGRSRAFVYTNQSTACQFVYDGSGRNLSDHKFCSGGFVFT